MATPRRKDSPEGITALLQRMQGGDPDAVNELVPLVYDQLKQIARHQMRSRKRSHTLSPTALVHEIFLKLKKAGAVKSRDRAHFFAIAAQTMRWLLADNVRARHSEKRGGDQIARVEFDENQHTPPADDDLRMLEDALKKLETMDPRACRVVELRQLVGLSIQETADALGISPMTVKRDWLVAKAWLANELGIKPSE
jgi:RNA polymerase sigma factor (TIGR02999 family)